MIPTHLQGKSATEIVTEQRQRFISKSYHNVNERIIYRIAELEILLMLAVKDALCNAEEIKELIQDGEYKAQQRAIVFLNTILPKE